MFRPRLAALIACLVMICGSLCLSFAQEPKTVLSDDAQASMLLSRFTELDRRFIKTLRTSESMTKEEFLQQFQEINDVWLVLEESIRDFIEKHPDVKTFDLLQSLIYGMCFFEVQTDREKLNALKEFQKRFDLPGVKLLLERDQYDDQYDDFVQGNLTAALYAKSRRLLRYAGDDESARDEVRKEYSRYVDLQRDAFQSNRDDPKWRVVRYRSALERATILFGSEEWIRKHVQDLKDYYLALDDLRNQVVTDLIDGIIRRGMLKGNAMEFEAYQLDGTKIDIRDFRGKVVLIDFWATWCGPCIASFPEVEKHYKRYRDQGFVVIAYSIDEDLDTLRDYETKHGHPWISTSAQLTLDKGGRNYADYYGISGIPYYILVGRDGKVIEPKTHPAMPNFAKMLEKALEEK